MASFQKPLLTFALVAYNQEPFIREAVEGALSQTYSPLEIILSDDCSSDRTFDIMQEVTLNYKGNHLVILNRNKENMGILSHINYIMELASGECVMLAAGDDISLPNRADLSWKILEEHPGAMCVSLGVIPIDAKGKIIREGSEPKAKSFLRKYNIQDYLARPGFHLHGASRAFRKCVHDAFGPLDSITAAEEDTTILLRCLMMGYVVECSEVGIYYRIHKNSLSGSGKNRLWNQDFLFKQWMRDIEHACRVGMISDSLMDGIAKQAKINLARRKTRALFKQSRHKIRFALSHILFSNTHTLKEKTDMMLYVLKDTLRKVKSHIKNYLDGYGNHFSA